MYGIFPCSAWFTVAIESFLPSCYLGLSIAGGKGAAANRIFVVDVKKGGPAEKNGQIQQADEILEVNDVTIRGLTHYEASAILKVSLCNRVIT